MAKSRMDSKISTGVLHKMPADLRKALASDPAAQAAWEDITPLARNEWICWTISTKKPETRRNHIVEEWEAGMELPKDSPNENGAF